MTSLHPHLLWVQDKKFVHVTIELENSGECSFNLGASSVDNADEDRLMFKTVCNSQEYKIDFPLFGKIIKQESSLQWNQRQIYITLRKMGRVEWTYLTTEHQKWKNWIKTDWKGWEEGRNTHLCDSSDSDPESDYQNPVTITGAVDSEQDLGDLLGELNQDIGVDEADKIDTNILEFLDTTKESELSDVEQDLILDSTLENILT
tara:strand:+ start:151 stop:762 length:612 start_codon:yes stop_codon:yes gene_type:complete